MDEAVVDDLAAEQAALDALVAHVDEAAWETPTPAEGWNVRAQVAHLAFFDEVALVSLSGDGEARFRELGRSRRDPEARKRTASPGEGKKGAEVLAWWRDARAQEVAAFRAVDPTARVPWGPNLMAAPSLCTARLMETWAHGLDCFMALGVEPEDTDRLRHVCHITYRAIPHAFRDAKREMPGTLDDLVVEVSSPSGELWRYGSPSAPQRIEGTAAEFARVGVRRMKRADAKTLRADGPLADAALDTLKAYL
ncbi:MAG: maleylpyruvate isomerase family mycothiol-dependent enzyme [Acidimicrobiia bacterium]